MTSTSTDAARLPVSAALDARGGPSSLVEEVTTLHGEFRAPLMRYLVASRVAPEVAEEIVQEVFLALFRHLQAGKPRQNLRGWVFRVAHNLMLKHRQALRVAQRHEAVEGTFDVEARPDTAPGPDEELARRVRRERLMAVVAALPERDRACVHLRAEGLRYREIAAALGVSLGTVAMSLARSLGRLARADERER